MANLVQKAVGRNRAQRSPPLRVPSTDNVERWQRMISSARTRGFRDATRVLQNRMVDALIVLQREVDEAIYVASKSDEEPTEMTTSDTMADLIAIQEDFPACEFDFTKQTVTVTTEPIEMDYIHLGSFEIELELKFIGQSNPYRVIATDPNPAATCDSTTHPHVQSESLCEGEGQEPIKRALADGRLHDFFTIVNQILQTYNPFSAYTTLSDWSGVECRDCGSSVSDDEVSSCSRCDGQLCGECTCSCESCCEPYCDECMTTCESCDSSFCGGCIESCDRCDKPFCKDCLTEDKCDDCIDEENEEKETDEADAAENESAGVAVQPLCLAEAGLPA